jgi:NadR type nicotinamide-nucleotide adenylyltransferase
MRKIGLTLGKFAPFHRGHHYLLETALREMDELVVLVYDCPEVIRVPLAVRANWVRRCYPAAEVIEAWNCPREVGDTPEIKKINEDYVFQLLPGREFSHFYCSEFYGEHMSQALGAINRLVDPGRGYIPISATQIRADPYAQRHFLDPRIYRDLITNVVLLGAPSTGKTTLAAALAAEYQTVWMPEYGREYWDAHQVNRRLTLAQLLEIAQGHLVREEQRLQDARRYLFSDTNAITTYLFSRYYHGRAEPLLRQLAAQCAQRYQRVFLCEDDIPYDATPDRSGEVQRREFQVAMRRYLDRHGIAYSPIRGSLTERIAAVKQILPGGAWSLNPGLDGIFQK